MKNDYSSNNSNSKININNNKDMKKPHTRIRIYFDKISIDWQRTFERKREQATKKTFN